MYVSSCIKKIILVGLVVIFGINPILVYAETDFFPNATSVSTTEAQELDAVAVIQAGEPPARQLVAEPIVRVGLYKTVEAVVFTSDFVYEIWIDNTMRGVISPGEKTEVRYSSGVYMVKNENFEFGSTSYIRLVPQEANSFFILTNYNRPVKGRGKINFNAYRGVFEYRYSPKSKLPYIINELPLNAYVQGVAETHDGAAPEYLKALSVAVRSYANALISKVPATEKRLFDVYATTVDQLYLGYNSESFMPRFVEAAQATAGEMVLYQGNPVITFYFSRSNGKTKNGSKDRPWLKAVEAKYDKGKKMLGHGIGMSNADAQQRAIKDEWGYAQILEYYYTSTTVERVF